MMSDKMTEFSLTELARSPSKILKTARSRSVALTRHGKREFIILTTREYNLLSSFQTSGNMASSGFPQGKNEKSVCDFTHVVQNPPVDKGDAS